MDNRTVCDGCGRATPTIHGRCPNCWHVKQPVAGGAEAAVRPAREQTRSRSTRLGDELLELLWFAPGLVLLAVALLAGGDGVLLVIALVLLLGGGVARFGDLFLP